MKIKELKSKEEYNYECYIFNEYKNYNNNDEWGCAFVWLDNIGVEYNYCIDEKTNKTNYCAIYKMELNPDTEKFDTDHCTFIYYEIDFNNLNWKNELENAMCEALIKFFDL